ncbi:putative beta-carotene-binding protein [Battus philenor]|uniref:putative beta-carotene-binding protein n=1 Tax=Battus philenor TaxID=42288 RepID=UPI0035CF44FD
MGQNPGSIIKPCRRNDEACMIESANKVIPIIATGVPSLNVDPIDPFHLKEFQLNAPKFFVNATNNEVAGYKSCVFQSVKFNWEVSSLKLELICPSITISGHLEISGELPGFPVERNNEFKLTSGEYSLTLSCKFEKVKGADGKTHMRITDVENSSELRGGVDLDYEGFKPKTEPEAVEFKKNYAETLYELARPSFAKLKYEYIFKNVNKLLESVPFDDMFLD